MLLDEQQADPAVSLTALLLPTGRTERRVRIALHVCLERAANDRQLLGDIDALSVYLMGHGDPATGNVLLALGDQLREEAR